MKPYTWLAIREQSDGWQVLVRHEGGPNPIPWYPPTSYCLFPSKQEAVSKCLDIFRKYPRVGGDIEYLKGTP